ncbi:hypothetical protein CRUP_027733 [Coryphaenoides rupestris]|nr:hypothetical protein CRUP_027733 [Coryphaenoides rupestris]
MFTGHAAAHMSHALCRGSCPSVNWFLTPTRPHHRAFVCGPLGPRGFCRGGHRRYFVLREREPRDHGAPARLECYESEKKWRGGSAPKRVVTLDAACLCVNKRADAKHRHLVALYTRDEYFAVAADSEAERDAWFLALSELVAEGKRAPAATSSLVGFEEAEPGYGPAPGSAYTEVWQVAVKAKGLGQARNLTGVYRLCLSSRAVGLVKLNAAAAAVSLRLTDVRRCGHSDAFFFMEVGRSAATGPGEFWMQAEDAVVAQNIHETVLDAMKAMRELEAEFRPRSKSQSAAAGGSAPISVPARRHPSLLPAVGPPLRRSRADGAASPPARTPAPCRLRTASEGDGGVARPTSVSVSLGGSPAPSPPYGGGAHLIRSHTLSSGRTCRMLESGLQHSRSMPSPPPAAAGPRPLSMSPGRGGGALTPDLRAPRRPFSCSASVGGSPGDAGLLLLGCEEYGDARYPPLGRSETPDSLSSTPPAPPPYVVMEPPGGEVRKRTFSLTTPRQPRTVAPPLSSASLDDYTLMRLAGCCHGAPPTPPTPEDGAHLAGSSPRLHDDDGYMPMTPGVVDEDTPTSPMCVSAPQRILNPRARGSYKMAASPGSGGYKMVASPGGSSGGGYKMAASPGSSSGGYKMAASPGGSSGGSYKMAASPGGSSGGGSLEERGYMRMWCGESPAPTTGEYMNMLPGNRPPDPLPGAVAPPSQPAAPQSSRSDPYVLMSPQSRRPPGGEDDYYAVMRPHCSPGPCPSPGPSPSAAQRGRPTRLALAGVPTLPSMTEHPPAAAGPHGPAHEYVNIDFGGARLPPGPPCDYMDPEPREAVEAGEAGPERLPEASLCPLREADSDYTEMTFDLSGSPLQPLLQTASADRSLSPEAPPRGPSFPLGAKVIRALPQGRRRHSSETFSSTATVTPVTPSFAPADALKRHSSVENVSARASDASDDDGGSPPPAPAFRQGGVGGGLDGYMALNLLEAAGSEAHKGRGGGGFKPANSCKGGTDG